MAGSLLHSAVRKPGLRNFVVPTSCRPVVPRSGWLTCRHRVLPCCLDRCCVATPPFMLFISAVRLLMEPAWSIVEGPFLADLAQSSLVFARARLAGEVKRQVGRLSGTTAVAAGRSPDTTAAAAGCDSAASFAGGSAASAALRVTPRPRD